MSLYERAARILEDVEAKKGSVYSLSSTYPDARHLCALIFETLKHKPLLEQVIERSGFGCYEKKVPRTLALLMIHDLLLSKHGLFRCRKSIRDAVLRHKTRLHAELVRIRLKNITSDSNDPIGFVISLMNISAYLIIAIRPRWARINTLKTNLSQVLDRFPHFSDSSIDTLLPNTYAIDTHIPDLLAFHSSTALTQHPAYLDGSLILQDKASCVPAFVLSPPSKSHVIDACASPGNKTTHLAAIMKGTGHIFAFERNAQRFDTLKTMVNKAGAAHMVTTICLDFTKTNVYDPMFQHVTHILLDPSCSGSGRQNKEDSLQKEDAAALNKRLQRLSLFQLRLVTHAMKFPSALKITYSTCSIHYIENEGVAVHALKSEVAQKRGWRIAHIMPDWPTRGEKDNTSNNKELATHVSNSSIRCNSDEMTGFFVCCFVRDVENQNIEIV
ncbi:hypothetical protein T552_02350 [Pneumocystis carinii B80]|uniref:SAM-dependent MTase RsmB/NOP-type domain-containing protein n=1 Tax=Pneumocystis carinii (strain B80) TaxID=1408658 RepID=A0A0W4ZG68_PNEC8|nr:hypothetical protein T552_02350 [Pneumocystis carinii B80]KTW27371.1 hypothetical protein T552_02350 [Pneumocystis carinii B80]